MSRQKRKQTKKGAPKAAPKAAKPRFPRLKKVLSCLFTGLLALMLAVVFYVAVVMGQPAAQVMESAARTPLEQPALPAQPAYSTQSASDMVALLGQFPAPVLGFDEASGLAFVSGRVYDLAYEGDFARLLEMVYLTPMGQRVTLTSLYPARAFELLGRQGYTLTSGQGLLGGLNAVVMTGPEGLRLHAQGEEAIYALTCPAMESQALSDLTRQTCLIHPS